MALKQYTFNERRTILLNDILSSLLNADEHSYNYVNNFNQMMYQAQESGDIFSVDFEKEVKLRYGFSGDKNDPEYLLAKICFVITFFRAMGSWNQKFNSLILRVVEQMIILFPEYEIDFKSGGNFPDWKSKAEATIVENIADLNEDVANPITELLRPMKSENELIGLISKVYSKIEHIDSQKQAHLVKTDKDILETTVRFVKHLVNRVDSAKGHSSDSSLSVKDIAHNVALGASLIHKLIKN